jgi:hypothetical protein
MNKKPQRSNVRAPTTQPTAAITPSGTLAIDGEFPLSASNGVTPPEPLAAHDVLQAAMAPRDGEQPDAPASADGAATDTSAEAAVASAPQQDAPENNVPAAGKAGKKGGKKSAKAAVEATAATDNTDNMDSRATKKARAAESAKAAGKVAKDKFVKCTFSLPESEMLVLDGLKKTHQVGGAALKKSQLLRVALLALADVDAERIAQLAAQLPAEPAPGKKKK